ncbi:MAG TPA: hypothetical protein PLZ55_00765 [bacterium]|nr:hypothetical protein [bacterium]
MDDRRGSVFVTLSAALMLTFVALTLLTAVLGKIAYAARQSHRLLLDAQAEFLAEGAIEHAAAILRETPETVQRDYDTFITPVSVGSAGQVEEGQEETAIMAAYGFTAVLVENPQGIDVPLGEIQSVFLVTGYGEVPYRETVLKCSVKKFCVLRNDGNWSVLPVAGGGQLRIRN